jgi:chemotaxis protein CheC
MSGNSQVQTISIVRNIEQQKLRMSALNEIANIGIGHAANSLASICGKDFKISVPRVLPISFDNVHELIESKPHDYAVVYMAVTGDFNGRMAFFLDWESCQALWHMLLGSAPRCPDDISEIEWSSVVEVGNIINGSFLSAFTQFTGLFSNATPPMLAVDQFEAIIGSIAAESIEKHVALFIETKLWDADAKVSGSFLLIPSQESVELLWDSLGLSEAA